MKLATKSGSIVNDSDFSKFTHMHRQLKFPYRNKIPMKLVVWGFPSIIHIYDTKLYIFSKKKKHKNKNDPIGFMYT